MRALALNASEHCNHCLYSTLDLELPAVVVGEGTVQVRKATLRSLSSLWKASKDSKDSIDLTWWQGRPHSLRLASIGLG